MWGFSLPLLVLVVALGIGIATKIQRKCAACGATLNRVGALGTAYAPRCRHCGAEQV